MSDSNKEQGNIAALAKALEKAKDQERKLPEGVVRDKDGRKITLNEK